MCKAVIRANPSALAPARPLTLRRVQDPHESENRAGLVGAVKDARGAWKSREAQEADLRACRCTACRRTSEVRRPCGAHRTARWRPAPPAASRHVCTHRATQSRCTVAAQRFILRRHPELSTVGQTLPLRNDCGETHSGRGRGGAARQQQHRRRPRVVRTCMSVQWPPGCSATNLLTSSTRPSTTTHASPSLSCRATSAIVYLRMVDTPLRTPPPTLIGDVCIAPWLQRPRGIRGQ